MHDKGAVAVRLLGERVELGNGVVEGLFGKVAGTVGRVKDLIVEDGEVESQAEADRVGRGQLGLGNIGSALRCEKKKKEKRITLVKGLWRASRENTTSYFYLVGLVGRGGGSLALLARGKLGEITVVVSLPTIKS